MPSVVETCVRLTLLLSLVSPMGCKRATAADFEMVALGFESSSVQLASDAYSPVGTFAEIHGRFVPFMDANGDRKFDPATEASGRCDQRSRRCRLEDHRVRMIMATTECSQTTGTWLVGDVYSRQGQRLEATLCDDQGTCSEVHEDAFQNMSSVNAIWIPGLPEMASSRTLSLRAEHREFRYEDAALPLPIKIVTLQAERTNGLSVSLTADQSIDMAWLWVMQGPVRLWSSSGQAEVFLANGTALEARIPKSVLDSCGVACEVYLQLAHVWRDDDLLSVAIIDRRVL